MGTTSLPSAAMQPASPPISAPVNRRNFRYRNRERKLYRELATLLVKPDIQSSASRTQLLELAISTIKHYRSRSGSFDLWTAQILFNSRFFLVWLRPLVWFSSSLNLFRFSSWLPSFPPIWRFKIPKSKYLPITPCVWITAGSFWGSDLVRLTYSGLKVLTNFLGVVRFSMNVQSYCGLLNSGWSFNFLQICREFTLLQRHRLSHPSTRSRPDSSFSEYVQWLYVIIGQFYIF